MGKYEFEVKMSCGGCQKAVERALSKLDGLSSVDVNLEKQSVTVESDTVDYDTVLDKIKKTGKTVVGGKSL